MLLEIQQLTLDLATLLVIFLSKEIVVHWMVLSLTVLLIMILSIMIAIAIPLVEIEVAISAIVILAPAPRSDHGGISFMNFPALFASP